MEAKEGMRQELKQCICGDYPKLVIKKSGKYMVKCSCDRRTVFWNSPDKAKDVWNERKY